MAGKYRKTRPAEGGIKARGTGRGTIGEQWWSRRFIDVMESFADPGRLARGRTYARKGQVLWLAVGSGEVRARVQGSEDDPYEVTVGIQALPAETWERVEAELSARALFRAQLLSGEMPPEIELVFAELGVSLFPRSHGDLAMMCDCMDYGDPCKHAAAVLYVLAESFDADPFLILAWHGRTRDQLLTALRRRPATAPDPLDVPDTPLTATDFWTPATGLARLHNRPPVPAIPPGLLLQLVEPPKIRIRRRTLTDVLDPAYAHLPNATQ